MATNTLARLAAELSSGRIRVVDLTQTLAPEFPQIVLPPEFGQARPFRIDEVSRYDERGPAWYWNNFSCGEHTGTHFDAPIHWISGRDLPNNATDTIPVQELIGPACVLDCSREAAADHDFLLTVDFVRRWERRHGRIPSRAWVLMRTDWSKRRDPVEYRESRRNRPAHAGAGRGGGPVPRRGARRRRLRLGGDWHRCGARVSPEAALPVSLLHAGNGRYGLQCLTNLDLLRRPARSSSVRRSRSARVRAVRCASWPSSRSRRPGARRSARPPAQARRGGADAGARGPAMSMWRPPERVRHDARPGRWPTADEAAASRLFAPVRVGAHELPHRGWVPAMVPWRATEDGFVTDANVLEWYERFARGRPAAIVVEATGIRDVPSGPLLRIGHDRFLPGLRELVRLCREASGGETRLLIQIIDFLAIRRRPDPDKFFARFLAVTEPSTVRRLGRRRLAGRRRCARALAAARPTTSSDAVLDDARARGAALRLPRARHRHGPRHGRASCRECCPTSSPAAASRARGRLRRRRAALRARVHDGVVPLATERSRATATAWSREPRAAAARGVRGGARDGRRRLHGRLPVPRRGVHRRRQHASTTRAGSASSSRARAWTSCRSRAAASSTTRSSPRSARPPIPTPARAATSACRSTCPTSAGPSVATSIRRARSGRRCARPGLATPVVVTGGIHGFEQAEALLARGQRRRRRCSAPEPRRSRTGSRRSVVAAARRCIVCEYTNYCEALDQKHHQVTCQLWDREALNEPGVSKFSDGKRRLVPPEWE